jgi:hypothetical protein
VPHSERIEEDGKVAEDREIARRSLDLQARARLQQGESPALIVYLDAMSMWPLPEEISVVSESELEGFLADLKKVLGK